MLVLNVILLLSVFLMFAYSALFQYTSTADSAPTHISNLKARVRSKSVEVSFAI